MEKLKLCILLFLLGGIFIPGFAQHTVCSGGTDGQGTNVKLSWTIGELACQTYSAGGVTLTQGQQQSNLTITSITQSTALDFKIDVFPNPVSDHVKLSVENGSQEKLSYALFDLSGHIIDRQEIVNQVSEISFTNLSPATYILKIYKTDSELKSYKIIKK